MQENKVVLITGGNSGIGRATATEFLSAGADVIITGKNESSVALAARELGVTGFRCDQSNLTDIQHTAKQIAHNYDGIDALVINAGIAGFAPIGVIDETHYDQIMNTNFKGALFTLQAFLPLMNEGSSIVFVSSAIVYTGSPHAAVYAASKAALNSLAKTAAAEVASKGIRVNTVCAGSIETPILGKTGLPEEMLTQFKEGIKNKTPMKRFGRSEEMAKLIAFLSSSSASFITGGEYIADGGMSLNPITG